MLFYRQFSHAFRVYFKNFCSETLLMPKKFGFKSLIFKLIFGHFVLKSGPDYAYAIL